MNLKKQTAEAYVTFLGNHIGLLTGCFVAIAFCFGYVTTYSLSSQFGFDLNFYFGITDYFSLPLMHPRYVLTSLVVLLFGTLTIFDSRQFNTPTSSKGYRSLALNFVFIASVVASLVYTSSIGHSIKNGEMERTSVTLRSSKVISCTSMITANLQFVFVWDFSDQVPKVIPRSDIELLEIVVPASLTNFREFLSARQKKNPATGMTTNGEFELSRQSRIRELCGENLGN